MCLCYHVVIILFRQVGKLSLLFEREVVVRELVPLALALLQDSVAAVRKHAKTGVLALIPLSCRSQMHTLLIFILLILLTIVVVIGQVAVE